MNMAQLYKEKLFLKELSEQELSDLKATGFCEADKIRADAALAEENRIFLASYPADTVLSKQNLLKNSRKRKKFFIPLLPSLSFAGAVCAVLITAVILSTGTERTAFTAHGTHTAGERIKGADPLLFVYKKSAEQGAVLLKNKSVVYPHDVLQVSYVSGGNRYGAIISVDGSGVVTRHYPDGETASGELESSGETLLDFSYELDEAPDFERFIFVSSNTRISLEALNQAFAGAKNSRDLLKLDPADYITEDCRVAEVVLLKEH